MEGGKGRGANPKRTAEKKESRNGQIFAGVGLCLIKVEVRVQKRGRERGVRELGAEGGPAWERDQDYFEGTALREGCASPRKRGERREEGRVLLREVSKPPGF